MKKIFIILSFIFLFNSLCCYAIEETKIDLATAVEIAKKNNLDIKASKMDLDIAKNEIKIANKLQNPSVQAFWNFGKAGRGNPNQIGLAETIEVFKSAPRKNLAKVNYKLTETDVEKQNFEIKMNVAEAYVKLVVAKSLLQKYEKQQKFLENLLYISKQDSGKNKQDLGKLEAKIALNQIITKVNNAKTNAKIAKIEFNKVINSPNEFYDSAESELSKDTNLKGINIPKLSSELPQFKDIENSAITKRRDIKIAEYQVDYAKKNLVVVMRQLVPDVEISGGYAYQASNYSEDGTYKSGAYLQAGIVNLPLLYAYKPEIKNAKIEIEKANLNYISTVNKAKKSVEIAYENFVTSLINLESYNDSILKDADELFNLFEKKYRVQKVDFASLAAVEESYQDLVVGYSETLSDYYISWINFLREINTEDFSFLNQKL